MKGSEKGDTKVCQGIRSSEITLLVNADSAVIQSVLAAKPSPHPSGGASSAHELTKFSSMCAGSIQPSAIPPPFVHAGSMHPGLQSHKTPERENPSTVDCGTPLPVRFNLRLIPQYTDLSLLMTRYTPSPPLICLLRLSLVYCSTTLLFPFSSC